MAYEQRPNTFALFINKKHRDNPKAPSMKGDGCIVINGVTYDVDLAAWGKESERAGRFLSGTIKIKVPDEQYDHRGGNGSQVAPPDDDLPWEE